MSFENSGPKDEDMVIRCKNIGKCYRIYDSPAARLKQSLWRGRRQYFRDFWALRHVNLEVKRGESLGIIGRNGSGKSTLLQLICRTLLPTEGFIEGNGRIAALLELGSGFNPEFTGLENIHLNASMLGLKKDEIIDRLDSIISFAEIGDFINQPVKSYSSGMSMRLAFAVAANVKAAVLIVDEALSVGDHTFQQKCFDYLRKFKEDGGTTILVSHDNYSIKRFCSKALWLNKGSVTEQGEASLVVDKYRDWCDNIKDTSYSTSSRQQTAAPSILPNPEKTFDEHTLYADSSLAVRSAGIRTLEEESPSRIKQLSECSLSFEIKSFTLPLNSHIRLGFWIRDAKSFEVCGSNTVRDLPRLQSPNPGMPLRIEFRFDMPALCPGHYSIRFNVDILNSGPDSISEWETLVLVDSCLPFYVDQAQELNDRPYGLIGLPCKARTAGHS